MHAIETQDQHRLGLAQILFSIVNGLERKDLFQKITGYDIDRSQYCAYIFIIKILIVFRFTVVLFFFSKSKYLLIKLLQTYIGAYIYTDIKNSETSALLII